MKLPPFWPPTRTRQELARGLFVLITVFVLAAMFIALGSSVLNFTLSRKEFFEFLLLASAVIIGPFVYLFRIPRQKQDGHAPPSGPVAYQEIKRPEDLSKLEYGEFLERGLQHD